MKMMKLATGQPNPRIMSPIECSAACAVSGACSCANTADANTSEVTANKAVATLFFNSQARRNVVCTFNSFACLGGSTEDARDDRARQVRRVAIERGARLFRFLLYSRVRRLQFLFDGGASGCEKLGALVERHFAHVVHLSIDLAT